MSVRKAPFEGLFNLLATARDTSGSSALGAGAGSATAATNNNTENQENVEWPPRRKKNDIRSTFDTSYWGEEDNNETEANANLDTFKSSLPDKDKHLAKLLTLEFYILCPNGKRIRVQDLCKEYTADPKQALAYRTFDDRLVIVVQAVFPGEQTPYWNQAFYLSTGESSGMPNTWFPFNGVVLKSDLDYYENGKGPSRMYHERHRSKNERHVGIWFSKEDFHTQGTKTIFEFLRAVEVPIPPKKPARTKKQYLNELFGHFYLPEGNYSLSDFYNRIGIPSYFLASYALGGDHYDKIFIAVQNWFKNKELNDLYTAHFSQPSPAQTCLKAMSQTYPIVKPYVVNAYIDKHNAQTYMNAFRPLGIFPPGFALANVPIKDAGYSLPVGEYRGQISMAVYTIWEAYMLGTMSIEEVKAIFANPTRKMVPLIKKIREKYILPNDPRYSFYSDYDYMSNKIKPYYGFAPGTRGGRSKKRTLRKRTRKLRSRK